MPTPIINISQVSVSGTDAAMIGADKRATGEASSDGPVRGSTKPVGASVVRIGRAARAIGSVGLSGMLPDGTGSWCRT